MGRTGRTMFGAEGAESCVSAARDAAAPVPEKEGVALSGPGGSLRRANAATFVCADGYRQVFPLRWLLERGAVLADEVGGQRSGSMVGAANQLWMAGVPAKLFMRDVVSISFDLLEEEPEPPSFETDEMAFQNRPHVSVGPLDEPWSARGFATYAVDEPVQVGGYAYDYDRQICRVEVSFDGGDTWAACFLPPAPRCTARRWAYTFVPARPGRYALLARSVNEDGQASPIPASWEFDVCEPGR